MWTTKEALLCTAADAMAVAMTMAVVFVHQSLVCGLWSRVAALHLFCVLTTNVCTFCLDAC